MGKSVWNIYQEEDFLSEFVKIYNSKNPENIITNYKKQDPPEPDFLVTFKDGASVYIEVTQIPAYPKNVAPHNHNLETFCLEVRAELDKRLPKDYGKIVVDIAGKLNEVPTKRKYKQRQLLVNDCVTFLLAYSTERTSFFLNGEMPANLQTLENVIIHYMKNSRREVLVIPNTYEAYWEEERVDSLNTSVEIKSNKKYELKHASKAWLLIRDREGFQTIANALVKKGQQITTDKFENVFLQEEYDPVTKTYPFITLK